jgi:hypothetical protein
MSTRFPPPHAEKVTRHLPSSHIGSAQPSAGPAPVSRKPRQVQRGASAYEEVGHRLSPLRRSSSSRRSLLTLAQEVCFDASRRLLGVRPSPARQGSAGLTATCALPGRAAFSMLHVPVGISRAERLPVLLLDRAGRAGASVAPPQSCGAVPLPGCLAAPAGLRIHARGRICV